MFKRVVSLILFMVIALSVFPASVSAEELLANNTENVEYFSFDIDFQLDENNKSNFNIILSIKDIQEELQNVEFFVEFDSSVVLPVVTQADMSESYLITECPMYTMQIGNKEFQEKRYDLIRKYDIKNNYFQMFIMDIVNYAGAKEGEEYPGLINDGDLVLSIPFQIIGEGKLLIDINVSNVSGTTKDQKSILGIGSRVVTSVYIEDDTSEDVTFEDVTSEDVTSEDPSEESSEESSEAPVDPYFGFDMSATLNAEDSSIIDVVLSIKDVKEQLDVVELLLNFDPALVEGVVQESERPMDVFMTKVPTYTMVVQGMEFQMPRYEQICTYEPENKYYHLRFIDLIQYASAKPGEEYPGLINDGDLIVTIQFRIIDADATEFTFTATDVKGATTVGLNIVPGADASDKVEIKHDKYFGFDMSATVNEEDSSIIDVVLSIKDVKKELHAVEFLLNFDPSLVEGVVQESEKPMDVFMTKVPMYTMVVQGMEFKMPRFEQICTYEPENKYYHLRFIDLLQYASAKPGEEYPGLINDGDLIVTIQFRIIDADATEFTFTATDVKGTTTVDLNSCPGAKAEATMHYETKNPDSELYMDKTSNLMPNIKDETIARDLISALSKWGVNVTITDKDGKLLADNAKVGTGSIVVDSHNNKYSVIVLGDVDGSGTITSTDYLRVKRMLLSPSDIEEAYLLAANTNKEGGINSTDYLRIKGHFLGYIDLHAH